MVNSPSIKPFFFGWDGFGGVPLDSLDVNPFNKNWQGVLGKLAPLGPKKIPPNIVGNQCFKSRLPQRPSEKDDITIHFFFLGQFQDRIFLFFFVPFLYIGACLNPGSHWEKNHYYSTIRKLY